MKYRLLALDLDGTLLNSQKEITPEVRKALAWAKERGVYVVLSTGRIVGEAAEFAVNCPRGSDGHGGRHGDRHCIG